MENRWLSVAEISAYLGVKEPTLYKWIARKPDIPAHKVGRLWKFKVDEVDAWVRSGGAAPRNAKARKTDA
jgi:excisionase family DNA binding protein